MIGRFFGELSSLHAILLFCIPLLAWLPELPHLRRLPSWARGLTSVVLVGFAVSVILLRTQAKFEHDFHSTERRARTNHRFKTISTSGNRNPVGRTRRTS